MLEVLVGRTVEQAMVEVLEEEETAATARQRAHLEEVRVEQLEEQARLRDQEQLLRLDQVGWRSSHLQNKKLHFRNICLVLYQFGIKCCLGIAQGRRTAELAAARKAQQELEERVTAAALSGDYLEQLLPNVLESLRHVSEPVQKGKSTSPHSNFEESIFQTFTFIDFFRQMWAMSSCRGW